MIRSRCGFTHLSLLISCLAVTGCDTKPPVAAIGSPAEVVEQVGEGKDQSDGDGGGDGGGDTTVSEGTVVVDADQGMSTDAWKQWPAPDAVLVLTGEQHGYIEPCGCTGLENQKGGLARRHTLIKQVKEQGWNVVPLDVGNQIRRFGQQAGIKFQTTISSLKRLEYRVVGLGPDDLRLDAGLLLSEAAGDPSDPMQFVSANVSLIDPSLFPKARVIEAGTRKIGVTSILDPATIEQSLGDEIIVDDVVPALQKASAQLSDSDFKVLLYYGGKDAEDDVQELVGQVKGFDLVVVANEFGDPILEPAAISGADSKLIYTGHKGMYACLVALYQDSETPFRYARIPLTDAFPDSEEMLQSLATYQGHLKTVGLEGLNLSPIPHASGKRFVGSEACGECHTTAFDIWEKTPHFHATDSLVSPNNSRGAIQRHFDPECLSCHATGWNPQSFYPYESGYLGLKETPHMFGNGCENCHGPGSEHVAAENGDIDADEDMLTKIRQSMVLPYDKAKQHCMECHDLDNSPDFHKDGAFEKYWEKVKHYGKD